jgi:MFS family permease
VAAALAIPSGRWIGPVLIVALILAYGAAITSLGLALATWVPQLSRVLALCVGIYVGVTVGSVPLATVLFSGRRDSGNCAAMASPFFGVGYFSAGLAGPGFNAWPDVALWGLFWLVFYTAVALLLLKATLVSFDRCLGRIPEPLARPRFPRATRKRKRKRARLVTDDY